MGLGFLNNGKWVSEREDEDSQGKFIRPSTTFRHKLTADGSSGFKAEAGRYHLYISWACPWAQRTAIMRRLKGLEDSIGLSVVAPEIEQNGWEFSKEPDLIPDSVNGSRYLREVYLKADPVQLSILRHLLIATAWVQLLKSRIHTVSSTLLVMVLEQAGFRR